MIKKLVMSLVVLAAIGVSKAFAAGEPFVMVSSHVAVAPFTISVQNTVVSQIQVENLGASGTVIYSVNGATDTCKTSVTIPVLPSVAKEFIIKILSFTGAGEAQVRIFGGSK